jgi:outer membrane biosynthesis protein TonB
MEVLKDKNKRQSLIASVVFHIILMIVFIFYGLTMPDPIPEVIGLPVQLALGNTDMGSGDIQPQSTEMPEEVEAQEEVVEEVIETPEPIATQDAPSAYEVPKPVEKEKPVEKPVEKPKPVLDNKLKNVLNKKNLFQTKEDNTSKGQGTSDQAGDFGKQDGAAEGNSLNGTKDGGGISANLSGRSFKGAPRIQSDLQESGKIVINIIVDRNGNVVRATAGGRGTTITNAALTKRVLESARKAKFSPSENAALEQPGTLEYIFILE